MAGHKAKLQRPERYGIVPEVKVEKPKPKKKKSLKEKIFKKKDE